MRDKKVHPVPADLSLSHIPHDSPTPHRLDKLPKLAMVLCWKRKKKRRQGVLVAVGLMMMETEMERERETDPQPSTKHEPGSLAEAGPCDRARWLR